MAIKNIGDFLYKETKFKYAYHNIDKPFTIDIFEDQYMENYQMTNIKYLHYNISHTYVVKSKCLKSPSIMHEIRME